MSFTEDASLYLADFGVPLVGPGDTSFLALWDQPDELVTLSAASGVSRSYSITYATADITLKRNDPVQRDGAAYHVREVPRLIGDGMFCEAMLTKGPPA